MWVRGDSKPHWAVEQKTSEVVNPKVLPEFRPRWVFRIPELGDWAFLTGEFDRKFAVFH
jgi:hypothetical protein